MAPSTMAIIPVMRPVIPLPSNEPASFLPLTAKTRAMMPKTKPMKASQPAKKKEMNERAHPMIPNIMAISIWEILLSFDDFPLSLS